MTSPFTPTVFYRDPGAALGWLEAAFGFEVSLLVADESGKAVHAEMRFGEGRLGIGGEWASPEIVGPAAFKSPASLSGQGTQFVRVSLTDGIDAHCARAEAAGARITQRPRNEFYGARVYRALDPEGHVWTFEQEGPAITVEEMEAAGGVQFVVGR